jgi:hypothetical protein
MGNGGMSSLRRSVQALLDCGMISQEEVAFLCAVIAEEECCPTGAAAAGAADYSGAY